MSEQDTRMTLDEDLRRNNDAPSRNLRFTTPPRLSFGTRASFYRPRFAASAARRVGERKEKRTSNQEHVDLARRAVETRIFTRDDRTISREEAAHATFVHDRSLRTLRINTSRSRWRRDV